MVRVESYGYREVKDEEGRVVGWFVGTNFGVRVEDDER